MAFKKVYIPLDEDETESFELFIDDYTVEICYGCGCKYQRLTVPKEHINKLIKGLKNG